jgi:hypothetical protein
MLIQWPPLLLILLFSGTGFARDAKLLAQDRPSAAPELAERATATLVAHHFANVAAFVDGPRLFVVYENARYRDDRRALREAAALLLPDLDDGQELVLVPTNRAIPLIAARYAPEPGARLRESRDGGSASPPPPSEVSIDVAELPRPLLEAPRASSSFGRIDVVLHPWFEASFGDVDNPVASRTGVAPEIRVSLRPGLSLSAQALITVQDDLHTGESPVRPGLLTVNQTVRLPRNVFVSATAGTFNPNRYGADLETRAYFANGRLWAGAELGLTGAVSYTSDGWYRTPVQDRTALVEAGWRIAPYGLVLRTTAGMFLEGEQGVRVDMLRQFGELEIGGFVLASEEGTNGGVALRIPLLPAKRGAPAPLRLRAAEAYRWQYRYRGVVPGGRRFNTGNALEEFGRGGIPDYMEQSREE